MDDLTRNLDSARKHVEVAWTPERNRAAQRALMQRLAGRRSRRAATLMAAAAAALLTGYLVQPEPVKTSSAPAVQQNSAVFQLEDGSRIEPLGPASIVQRHEDSKARALVELVRGRARFTVTKDPARAFRVFAGPVTVEVIGTVFVVERAADTVHVQVERGRVRVSRGQENTELGAGEARFFSALAPLPAAPAPEPLVAADAGVAPPEVLEPKRAPAATGHDWRSSARAGDFELAYRALENAGNAAVRDEPGDLLLAADVARMSRHPQAAVPRLTRIVAAHRSDPRAPLAAFTLGRVLLEELGRPHEAANLFADARALDRSGELAEDALAREVEAWSRSGDGTRARQRAEEYQQLYPNGRRLRSVLRYGRQ